MRRLWLLAILVSLAATAANYDVSVTREGSNVYRIDGKDVMIHTKYCYEYGYGEDAVLHTEYPSGSLIFLDDHTTCDVDGVYGRVSQQAGKYSVSVSQDGDNWYGIDGTEMHVHTTMCMNLALGEDSVLQLNAMGSGTLYFLEDDDHCDVDGVYGEMRL